MSFAPIRKYQLRRALKQMGVSESPRSIDLAVDFALRFPQDNDEHIRVMKNLSYMNPGEFTEELDALRDICKGGKGPKQGPLTTSSSWPNERLCRDAPVESLYQLIRIYGKGRNAGNVLRALSGISVASDQNAKLISDIQKKLGITADYSVPIVALDFSKSPAELLSNYLASFLIKTELGFCIPPQVHKHISFLTRRSAVPAQYRERLEHVIFSSATNANIREMKYKETLFPYLAPSIAFVSQQGNSETSNASITQLWDEARKFPYHIVHFIGPATLCSTSVDDLRACLQTMIVSANSIRASNVKASVPYNLQYIECPAGSMDDFRRAVSATQEFIMRVGSVGLEKIETYVEPPRPGDMLRDFLSNIQWKSMAEYASTMNELTATLMEFPHQMRTAGAMAERIGKMSTTPAHLIKNTRIYQRLASTIDSAPLADLVKAVNEQESEDEAVDALLYFYTTIKDTSHYKFQDSMSSPDGSEAIWNEFLRTKALRRLVKMRRTGDVNIHVSIDTDTRAGWDISYLSEYSYSVITGVMVEIEPKENNSIATH